VGVCWIHSNVLVVSICGMTFMTLIIFNLWILIRSPGGL
jgi:hypothetical protein